MKTDDIISILQYVLKTEGIKDINAITVCDERLLIYRNNMVLQAPLIMVKTDLINIDFSKYKEK